MAILLAVLQNGLARSRPDDLMIETVLGLWCFGVAVGGAGFNPNPDEQKGELS